MKGGSTIFLQVLVVLICLGAFTFWFWEPHIEGRNVNASLFEIYFKDPFWRLRIWRLAFLLGLHQAFNVLGYVRQNQRFSQATVDALGTVVEAICDALECQPGDVLQHRK